MSVIRIFANLFIDGSYGSIGLVCVYSLLLLYALTEAEMNIIEGKNHEHRRNYYQHVKAMPMAKAIEVLHFVEFLETKPDTIANNDTGNDLLEFMQNLPVSKRTDAEINIDFQH